MIAAFSILYSLAGLIRILQAREGLSGSEGIRPAKKMGKINTIIDVVQILPRDGRELVLA